MPTNRKHNHYFRDVSNLEQIDLYRFFLLFGVTDPCYQHAIKKLVAPGLRGTKDADQDLAEAIDTLIRRQQISEEDANADTRTPPVEREAFVSPYEELLKELSMAADEVGLQFRWNAMSDHQLTINQICAFVGEIRHLREMAQKQEKADPTSGHRSPTSAFREVFAALRTEINRLELNRPWFGFSQSDMAIGQINAMSEEILKLREIAYSKTPAKGESK